MMNQENNRIEPINNTKEEEFKAKLAHLGLKAEDFHNNLLKPDGTPIPKHITIFKEGELIVCKNYTFRVAYMNETTLVLEPVSPLDELKVK